VTPSTVPPSTPPPVVRSSAPTTRTGIGASYTPPPLAVSLSVATWSSTLPIAYRLYLPKEWAEDSERREKTEVPEEVEFQTKPDIALGQIGAAVVANLDRGVVLADAAYSRRFGPANCNPRSSPRR
jgi:hypothetical protein